MAERKRPFGEKRTIHALLSLLLAHGYTADLQGDVQLVCEGNRFQR